MWGVTDLWLKYAHLGDPAHSTLHPLTPTHIRGYYERGRWARAIEDCPYGPIHSDHQEWYVGWLKEDEDILAAMEIDEDMFEEM